MACNGGLLKELKELVCQIGDGCNAPCCPPPPACCPEPCCPPCCFPYAQVCMTCPPPILAPTFPEPVKPLQLPCPIRCEPYEMSEEEGLKTRYDNFYNNYNIDWHADGYVPNKCDYQRPPCTPEKKKGFTVDGKSPCCEEPIRIDECCPQPGCPTGFKPCTMKLTPPCGCHPYGVWCAEVQPCPPKPKKKLLRPKQEGECGK